MIPKTREKANHEKVLYFYESTAKKYDSQYGKQTVWEIPYKIFLNLLSKRLKKGMRLLDCGGGTGKWAIPLAKKGLDVTLTDISENMINIAKIKSKKEGITMKFFLTNIENMCCLENSYYDVVLCMGDILSYSNYHKGLKEISRVIKRGGLIAGSVDSILGYLNVFKRNPKEFSTKKIINFLKTGNIIGTDGFKLHAFLQKELEGVLQKYGFEEVEIYNLPFMSSYFWDDAHFIKIFEKNYFINEMIKIECKFIGKFKGCGGSGPHHLYFFARKKGR